MNNVFLFYIKLLKIVSHKFESFIRNAYYIYAENPRLTWQVFSIAYVFDQINEQRHLQLRCRYISNFP